VGAQPVSRYLMLAYDDLYSIEYFQRRERAWWRRNGAAKIGAFSPAPASRKSFINVGHLGASISTFIPTDHRLINAEFTGKLRRVHMPALCGWNEQQPRGEKYPLTLNYV